MSATSRVQGGFVRRGLSVFFCFVLITFGLTGLGGPAGASTPTMTRVRLILSTTSEFASLRFTETYISTYHVTSKSVNASITRGSNVLLVSGTGAVSATIDMVLTVPTNASPVLVLSKGKAGSATAKVIRSNTTSAIVADFTNNESDGDYVVTRSIARSSLVGEGLTIPRLDQRKLVMAFYYPWFEEGKFSNGKMWYDTPTGSYATNTPKDVAAQVNLAAANGISGFIFSWDALYDRPKRFQYLLDAAAARTGFYASPVLELMTWRNFNGSFDVNAAINAAAAALNYANHPSFLRMPDGTPVLFAFGTNDFGASNWRAVASALTARGYDFFAVGDSPDAAFGFDGAYSYNPNGKTYQQLVNRNVATANALRLAAQVNPAVPQRLWAATASPGQNMSYLNPLSPKNVPREEGAQYDRTWRASLISSPEWVLVTSWNEWFEATHIAPSEKFGTRALTQTRGWSATFKEPATATPTSAEAQLIDLPLRLGRFGALR